MRFIPKIARGSAAPSFIFGVFGLLVAALYGADVLGGAGRLSVVVLTVLTLAAIPYGIRLHRPARRMPWMILAVALFLLIAELGIRGSEPPVGKLQYQSLLPDLIQLPAYLLMAVGLTMLAQSPDSSDRSNFDVILDGVMAMMAALTLSWVYLIEPLLARQGVPMSTRMLLASFPPLDVYLVMIAFRIGFDTRSRRATSGRFLLISVLMMLIGDSTYLITQVDRVHVSPLLVDLPYLVAATAFGAAAIHPSMRQLSMTRRRRVSGPESLPTRGRLLLVALALIVPSMVVASNRVPSLGNRLVVGAIALITALVATWRVFRALRASASSESRLAHQATHDELTGLPNRALVEQWIARMADEPSLSGAGMAVVFLDIDRFKLVNDTFGHSHGDLLLNQVAQRLESAVGQKGIVARIGGDEFVIVLADVSGSAEARREAELIRHCFGPQFNLGKDEVFVSASLGVSTSETNEPRTAAETMIRDADTAMYQAKEAGRDTVAVFDSSMRDRIADRLALEHDLRLAIEREEFRLEYQPIISLSDTGPRVLGLEALLRWEGPTRGLVPPGMFISIAEDSGLIVEIGDWVIHEACTQLSRWRQLAGLEHIFMSVNVSALQLKKASLLPRVRGALAQTDLTPDALCIELTESLLMENPADGTALLVRLKDLGVQLALDDFGTGYSSLAYLRQFPVDYVKIDKSFIDGLSRPDSSDETLVAAIVSMARALGAVTIAEGVEEPQQEERLRSIGADCAQGYYYARPVSGDRVVDTIRELMPNRGLRLVSGDGGGGSRGW
ncbi:MAG TPA: EAL domain-containing protein [Acidimicrobiales bacterium]|nr:EAL domain-containing protein [Acidimicrobiales bacterium]